LTTIGGGGSGETVVAGGADAHPTKLAATTKHQTRCIFTLIAAYPCLSIASNRGIFVDLPSDIAGSMLERRNQVFGFEKVALCSLQ
jgi:hypothetical protein